ncbi:MAG TPA: hypothetical protein VJ810_15255 [Blastocatellia bacterium]|nr:hypothetical protein [Blastocatellia bacterium]
MRNGQCFFPWRGFGHAALLRYLLKDHRADCGKKSVKPKIRLAPGMTSRIWNNSPGFGAP